MPKKTADIPTILIERVEASHPSPAYFLAEEIDDWPPESTKYLLQAGLLSTTSRAEAIICPGCPWSCSKSVIVRRAKGKEESRAFINCDESPGYGRIEIPLGRLQRYSTTLRDMCSALAHLLNLPEPKPSPSANAFSLGGWKGRHGVRPISVQFCAGELVVSVGDHSEGLQRLLSWSKSRVMVDRGAISRLADRKSQPSRSENLRASDRSRQDARVRQTKMRNAAILKEAKRLVKAGSNWSKAAGEIAGTRLAPDLTDKGVRRIVSRGRQHERKYSRPKRGARK